MNDFEKRMYQKYPKMLNGLTKTMRESCLVFGFECGQGWYSLLEKFFEDVDCCVKDNTIKEFVFSQIKEKFGQLRIYYHGYDEKLDKLILEIEKKSGEICEVCGEKGELKSENGWLTTLCNEHRKQRKQKNEY